MRLNDENILISDANHGGLILAGEYSKYTDNTIYFYDTYNKLSDRQKNELENKYNMKFLNLTHIQDNIDNYFTINPVHMKPVFKTDMTHHEFTGYLIDRHKKEHGWNFKIIEITGVKGKSSTVNLTGNIFKNKNTLILNSESLTYNTKNNTHMTLDTTLSITPASLIAAINKAYASGLTGDIDYFIAEVSLGTTGMSCISVITNIVENYPVAGNSYDAASAKKSAFKSENTICSLECYKKYYRDTGAENVFLISLENPCADLYAQNIDYNLDKTTVNITYDVDSRFNITTFALTDFYIENILLATGTGITAGIGIDEIIRNLKDSTPIKGRGSYKQVDDKTVFEDINSGLNTTSIKSCVDNIRKYDEDFTLIIGGDYGITCEEIDENKLLNYLKTLKHEDLILVSDVGCMISEKLDNPHIYFNNIKDAFKHAMKMENKLIQIIYRSRYDCDIYYR